MSWPSPLVWLGIIGTLATLTSLVLAWGAWETRQILARMDREAEASARRDRLGGCTEGMP